MAECLVRETQNLHIAVGRRSIPRSSHIFFTNSMLISIFLLLLFLELLFLCSRWWLRSEATPLCKNVFGIQAIITLINLLKAPEVCDTLLFYSKLISEETFFRASYMVGEKRIPTGTL